MREQLARRRGAPFPWSNPGLGTNSHVPKREMSSQEAPEKQTAPSAADSKSEKADMTLPLPPSIDRAYASGTSLSPSRAPLRCTVPDSDERTRTNQFAAAVAGNSAGNNRHRTLIRPLYASGRRWVCLVLETIGYRYDWSCQS